MKKSLRTAAILTLSALSMSANDKLSPSAELMLDAYRASQTAPLSQAAIQAARDYPGLISEVSALVTVNSSAGIACLEERGYEISDIVNDIAIVTIPLDEVESLAAEESIDYIDFGRRAIPMMDMARQSSNVDPVHDGSADGLNSTAYTGKGVVTSLFDTGLDPNHINFKDADGNARVKYLVKVMGTNAIITTYRTASSIRNFTTENTDETHGTHVLGIMAGAYKGEVTSNSATISNPYYGVAPGSDIAIGCGDLYDNNILKGVKAVSDYARSQGLPAVVNLSLGGTSGAHDEGDSFNSVLDTYGENAIILVAAGNDGDIPMGLNKSFTADDKTLQTFILPHVVTASGISHTASSFGGTLEFYSSDSRPFKFKAVVYNRSIFGNGTIVSEFPVDSSNSGSYVGGSSTSYNQMKNFDAASSASSYMRFRTGTTKNTDRYYVTVNYNLSMTNSQASSFIGFIIEGEDGQRINAYANATSQTKTGVYASFSGRNQEGWTDGSPNGTINSMGCGKNVIVIGSYTTRNSWPLISGTSRQTSHKVQDVTDFSSYGTIYDGTNLPHVCAPGAGIVASYSTYWSSLSKSASTMTAKTEGLSRDNYWGQMQGTSMATPFAAGTVALWLEADPTLKVDEVREIMQRTAIRDSYVESGDPVKWGAGKLDALAGLKEVLSRNAGVGTVFADDEHALIVRDLGGRRYNVFVAGEQAMTVSLVAVNGSTVKSIAADTNDIDLDASAVAPGVYILVVDGANSRLTRKIAIR